MLWDRGCADPDGLGTGGMDMDEAGHLQKELGRLREEHRDLDAAIMALVERPALDQLQIQRLKKRKLQLRDRIRLIEDVLLPDIIA